MQLLLNFFKKKKKFRLLGGRALDVGERGGGHLHNDRSVASRRNEAVHESHRDELHAANVVHRLPSVQVGVCFLQ